MTNITSEKIKEFLSTKGAKSAIVASCALLIGLAVYLNYRWFYDPASSLGFGENNMEFQNKEDLRELRGSNICVETKKSGLSFRFE